MPEEDLLTPVPGIENFTYEDVNILLNFSKLWIDVVLWMRSLFRSFLEDLPDLPTVMTRVFQGIPSDFYNEFRKHFNQEVSQQFLNIFSRLVMINWQLINAYKNNDRASIDASTQQWYRTADELAEYLSRINRYWDVNQLKTMLYEYIRLKLEEIVAFLTGDYELEARIYDEIEESAARLGIYLAMGIIRRRPLRPPTLPPPQPKPQP